MKHRVRKANYAEPLDLEHVMIGLMILCFILTILTLYMAIKWPWLSGLLIELNKVSFLLLLISFGYLAWQYRYYLPHCFSKNVLKILLLPSFDAWLVSNDLYIDDMKNKSYCYVPNVVLHQNLIEIASLPGLAKRLDDDEMLNELNNYLHAKYIGLTVYDGYPGDDGWYKFLVRKNKKEDQLHYE